MTMAPRAPASLSVGVVVYHSDLPLLARTLGSLATAVGSARMEGLLDGVTLTVVDNGSPDAAALDETVRASFPPKHDIVTDIRRGHGNVGYGRGHNDALESSAADYHMRIRRRSRIAYVNRVRIIHHGGEAAKKGKTHVRLFLASALRFFRTHGWKIA